jgi:UDP-N-acetylmuramoyl-tripeptide--D-alanyl-D-alanine ligase
MMTWSLSEMARLAQGQLVGADREFSSVSTDTRSLQSGALFVALSGPNFDGHDFVAAAAERGAAAALVQRPLTVAVPQVVVDDPLQALSTFARQWRRQFQIPVIGVTGSNGKTTTKEIIGAILSQLGSCLITRGNLNNHIGVPLMLMELRATHRFAVIEMGANHAGEIAHLASIAEPGIGIVTNAGAAHLEGFGSLQGVANGKGEMFRALPADGVAVINADDAFANQWLENRASDRTLTFGFEQRADFMAHKVQASSDAQGFKIDFDLVTPMGRQAATLHLAGLHNLRNALGAAAVANAAGASLQEIVSGLAAMRPVGGRLELKPALNGAFLVDDSYNANPSSLKAGLDALQSFGGARWLVLGDMMELGDSSDELHAEVGRYAKQAGIQRLLAIGPRSHFAVEAFGRGAQWFADIDALIGEARSTLAPGIAVLIKGSRANRLERVSAALATTPPSSSAHH